MNFIISGFTAVIAMTIFSATWNLFTQFEFREPSLMAKIFRKNYSDSISNSSKLLTAWLIHIVIGFIFLGLYELFWYVFNFDRTCTWAVLFGLFSGLLGVLGWHLMFKTFDYKSEFTYSHYYFHLVLAHIVFSCTAVYIYNGLQHL